MSSSLDLALLGGQPRFERVRPIGQLSSPDRGVFHGLLDRAILSESGVGPALVPELEQQLAELHGVDHCVAYSNACVALVALTELLAVKPGGEVILPAFTYMGLPHLVQWTGHRPRFCDVDPADHTLDPKAVRRAVGPDTAMILGVHQVQAACDIEEFDRISAEFGVPVIYDAVHGIFNTRGGVPIGGFGRAEVFSLHATKLLNGFEGGYITTQDEALAARVRTLRDGGRLAGAASGLPGLPAGPGLNGACPEFHAALALAGLQGLPEAVERNRMRYERYREGLAGLPGVRVLTYPEDGERRNYEFTLVWIEESFGFSRDEVVAVLLAEGTRARAYYGPPVHLSEHRPRWMEPPSLPVTEHLAQHIVQMPVGEHVSLQDIDVICEVFGVLADGGDRLRQKLGDRL